MHVAYYCGRHKQAPQAYWTDTAADYVLNSKAPLTQKEGKLVIDTPKQIIWAIGFKCTKPFCNIFTLRSLDLLQATYGNMLWCIPFNVLMPNRSTVRECCHVTMRGSVYVFDGQRFTCHATHAMGACLLHAWNAKGSSTFMQNLKRLYT